VVALGEGSHGDLNSLKFRLALIRDPRFSHTVNDIVVEAGNGRYQDRIDAYVRGDDVPAAIVREACRNTTNPNTGSDYPSFEEIFHAVRAVNLTLPSERRIRILLGDPPFDWSEVRGVADLARPGGILTPDRDPFVANLVLRESIAKKRRALIVYGDMHYRRSDKASLINHLESAGAKVFSIWERAMSTHTELLEHLYDRFNARDMEAALATMHPDVMWANGLEGGHVHGHDGVRNYWTRQWATMDSRAEPTGFSIGEDGRVHVEVHLTAHDLERNVPVLFDMKGCHVFQIEDGLIRRFDIR
jgi:ketosteroid isomerase-like protein